MPSHTTGQSEAPGQDNSQFSVESVPDDVHERPRRLKLRRREARGSTPVEESSLDSQVRNKVVGASFIGNFVEWFDYGAYGYFAAIIGSVFFPSSNPTTQLLSTYAVFALSFLVRPLGGFFWGRFGDRVGRKQALSLSILIMSGSTFLIALLPTYASVGILAPIGLLVLRMVQGFSASGEYAGAAAFLVEYAPRRRRGLYAAVVPASTATGLLVGSIFATVMTMTLSDQQMHDWGWRIPFLLAAPLGLVGRTIRNRLEDTPTFQQFVQEQEAEHTPVKELFGDHRRPLLLTFGAVLLNAVGFYILLSYMPTYLSEELKFDATESFIVTTIGLATYVGFIFVVGLLSDTLGRRTVLMTASIAFVVLTVPTFMLLGTKSLPIITLVMVVLGAMLTLNDGTLPSFLAEQFPTKVRYSGFAVSFNLANALFGGTAPFVATALIHATGSNLAPGFYLMAAAIISLGAVYLATETARRPLEHE